ncbi:putative mitochondrial adenine nucleotide transporter BTL3 [Hibiscus syriacus]|uniref:Mitochondrial adenine nucleotide transporter BTL3 n=1 Tax=Hibiscus syriacus TaxID=106335 RepID=A0A6A3AY57_HIBSY|nr:putative mitochondrial adenine nucleotide transporter BTL3 [Hibiscus syriacus]
MVSQQLNPDRPFLQAGLFLNDKTVPPSFVSSISLKTQKCFVDKNDNEGYVGESGEDDENLESAKIVEEEKEKEKKGSGALNTTKHLWAGAVAAMVSRSQLLKLSRNEEATNSERFLAGAADGITATLLCLPMDTIRTVMVAPGGEALGGLIGAFRHMIQTEGFFSLYEGLVPSIISMAPSSALFYGVYDILKSTYLRSLEGRKRIQNMKQGGQELNAFVQLELGPLFLICITISCHKLLGLRVHEDSSKGGAGIDI